MTRKRTHDNAGAGRLTTAGARFALALSMAVSFGGLSALRAVAQDEPRVIAIKAQSVHVGDGRVIEGATVLIRGGRIAAVGVDVEIPAGADVFDWAGAVTPGLIDAKAMLASGDTLPSAVPGVRSGAVGDGGEVWERREADEVVGAAQGGPGREILAAVLGVGPDGAPPMTSQSHGYLSDDDHIAAGFRNVVCSVCSGWHGGGSGGASAVSGSTVTGDEATAAGVRTAVAPAEQSSEVIPETRVVDALNPDCPDLDRLVRAGVTTIFVPGDSGAVISSRGVVLHTGGPVGQRVLQADGAVKATMGADSYRVGSWNRPPYGRADFHVRRPTTRMGVAWVFRKALYDTMNHRAGLPVHGADTPDLAAMRVLEGVLDGKIPLRIQARMQNDILTGLRLADEFHLSFTLEEATEAYRCIDAIAASGAPVVFGPIYIRATGVRSRTGETRRPRLDTFKLLLDAGVETALTAQDLREEDGLARQAMYAIRYGVSPEAALKAVSYTPAKVLGLDSELGTVEAGKRADLVLWTRAPFAATSRVAVVFVDGEMASDRR